MAGDPPAQVHPDIWRLPVPLPGHSVGHVNVYALLSSDGVVLVDTGWRSAASWNILDDLLKRVGSSAEQVRLVCLTHFHPDHCGLSGLLQQRTGAQIGMHGADARYLRERFSRSDEYEMATRAWVTATGAPDTIGHAALAQIQRSAGRVAEFFPDFRFVDGQCIAHGPWEIVAVHTPGHSPGHLCFYERTTDSLFSGDHILPHINTSPGFRPHSSPDPVQDYLASLDRLETLDVARVLPGHQRPFTHFAQRVQRLREHHARRLALTRRLVGEGRRTVWQVSSKLPRSRSWESLTDDAKISAMGETYGHLLQLASGGMLRSSAGPAIHWTAA